MKRMIGVRYVSAPKPLVHALGLNAAILLNEYCFWQDQAGGEFGRTVPQIEEETGLSKAEQAGAREKLRKLGLIEERKGAGHRTRTIVIDDALDAFIESLPVAGNPPTSGRKSSNQRQEIVQPAADFPPTHRTTHTTQEHTYHEDAIDLIVQSGTPYQFWEAFCESVGRDPNYLKGGMLQLQLRTAKLLIQDGVLREEVSGCGHWLNSQEWWRNRGFDLNDVRKQMPKWKGAGSPHFDRNQGSKLIRGSTPSI